VGRALCIFSPFLDDYSLYQNSPHRHRLIYCFMQEFKHRPRARRRGAPRTTLWIPRVALNCVMVRRTSLPRSHAPGFRLH